MRLFIALPVVLFARSASASVFTIPLARLQHNGEYLRGVAEADRERAALLASRPFNGPIPVPATNLAYAQYTMHVGIGDPPTYYDLIIDTGSSNTFCGTGHPYVRTNTSIFTRESVTVTYGSGFFEGLEYLDQVSLAPNLVITNQSIGDALSNLDFQGVDGILGVGPTDLTMGTLSPDKDRMIPTVMDNLVSQGIIKNKVLGIYFAPANNYSDENGVLSFGGVDRSLYMGELNYIPLTDTSPSSHYWGINVTQATYGNHTIIPTSTAGIVDTGTTLILLADDFFDVYMKAIPGAQLSSSLGLIEIPSSSISFMKPLTFLIAGKTFTMDVAAQLIPLSEGAALPNVQYGTVANMGNIGETGLDFIIGQKFMERYYAVFDADNARVGFAETNHTFTSYSD